MIDINKICCPSCGATNTSHNSWCKTHLLKRKPNKYMNLVKFDSLGYPSCEEHGAMNCVNPNRTIWRCLQCNIGIDVIRRELT